MWWCKGGMSATFARLLLAVRAITTPGPRLPRGRRRNFSPTSYVGRIVGHCVPDLRPLGPRLGGDDRPARLTAATCATTTLGPRLRGDDECAFRSTVARLTVALGLSGALVACGFHLRGEAHYAFDTMFLNSPPALPITTELKRSLEGAGTAKLVSAADKAQVVLDISSVEDNKQILSLSGGG